MRDVLAVIGECIAAHPAAAALAAIGPDPTAGPQLRGAAPCLREGPRG